MRWSTDVNVRAGGGPRNRGAKSQIRNAVLLQEVEQRAAFDAVRMKLNVHGVAMVQAPTLVNRALAEDGDGQLFMKRVGKKALNFKCVSQVPTTGASVTSERGRANQALLREPEIFCDLSVGFTEEEIVINVAERYVEWVMDE